MSRFLRRAAVFLFVSSVVLILFVAVDTAVWVGAVPGSWWSGLAHKHLVLGDSVRIPLQAVVAGGLMAAEAGILGSVQLVLLIGFRRLSRAPPPADPSANASAHAEEVQEFTGDLEPAELTEDEPTPAPTHLPAEAPPAAASPAPDPPAGGPPRMPALAAPPPAPPEPDGPMDPEDLPTPMLQAGAQAAPPRRPTARRPAPTRPEFLHQPSVAHPTPGHPVAVAVHPSGPAASRAEDLTGEFALPGADPGGDAADNADDDVDEEDLGDAGDQTEKFQIKPKDP